MAGLSAITLAKGALLAKGAWLTIEAIDTTMDGANLADDLARHFMGSKYDPKAARLYREACDAGIEYDKTLEKVQTASADIGNLIEGIRRISTIQIDYGDQQKIAFVQLDKLDKLKKRLSERTPTAYAWFEMVGTGASKESNDRKTDATRLNPVTPSAPWWMYSLRTFGLGLEIQAVYGSYNEFKKKKKELDEADPSGRRKARADIFEGIDPEEVKALQEVDTSKMKKIRSGLSTLGASLSWGLKKAATAGSFAINVYTIVSKVKGHEEAVQALNAEIGRYKGDKEIYDYMLNGVPNDSLIPKIRDFFKQGADSQIDIESEESRQALRDGFYKQISKYNELISRKNEKGEYVSGILPDMDAAYLSMIGQFEKAARPDEENDKKLIKTLNDSHQAFEISRQIAEDLQIRGSKRKDSLDSIADEFSGSIAKQLILILNRLNVILADHTCLNQLSTFAELLVKEENKIKQERDKLEESLTKKTKSKERKESKLSTTTDADDIEGLEEDIKDLDEEIADLNRKIDEQKSRFETNLNEQAMFALKLLDGNGSVLKDRQQFRDLDEVKEALRKLMEDLKQPASTMQ